MDVLLKDWILKFYLAHIVFGLGSKDFPQFCSRIKCLAILPDISSFLKDVIRMINLLE